MRCVGARMSMMYKMSNGLVAVDTTLYLVHPVGIATSAHRSTSFQRPSNLQPTTTKFFLHSLPKTMEYTTGYGCPGTLAGILQTAGVPDQSLRLNLTQPTSLLTTY